MRKKEKNSKKKFEPIIFMNSPISNEEKDAIGVMSIVDEIEAAIDEKASMIGVIAEYGAGKTSLTEILSNEDKYKNNIHISMWDTIVANDNNDIGNLTKSFIYQLAIGCSEHAASYVNKLLNNNYGIVSFSFGYIKVWIYLVIAVLCYAGYLVGSSIDYEVFVNLFGDDSGKVAYWIILLAPLLKIIALVFVALVVYFSTIVFSSWKTESNRKAGINEVFFAYSYVFNFLKKRKKDCVVIIEDLDRVDNKELIISFLKEIYRFNTLCRKKRGKVPVFLISISPEVLLDSNNMALKESNKPRTKEENQEANSEEWLYPKIFDFMVSLKPIHCDDYRNVIYQIITSEPEKQKRLNELLPFNDKVGDNYLPKAFSKLYRGENLSIRELKERLNQSIALFIELRNKDYYGNPSISFEVCACVTYLQRTYPKDFHILLKSEKKFSEIIQATYILRNQSCTTIDKIKQLIGEKLEKKLSDEMVTELATFIFEGLIDLDYRMYLYSFPKGSYIKNIDEKDICNCLEFPNDYSYNKDDLNDKIGRIQLFEKMDSIYGVVDRIANTEEIKEFPKSIFENEQLFRRACESNIEKTVLSFDKYINWEQNSSDTCCSILKTMVDFGIDLNDAFWKLYLEILHSKIINFDIETVIKVRRCFISEMRGFLIQLKDFFVNENVPIISTEEIKLIDSPSESLILVNVSTIDNTSAEYIQNLILCKRLDENVLDIAKNVQQKILEKGFIGENKAKVFEFINSNKVIDNYIFDYICNLVEKEELDKEHFYDYLNRVSEKKLPKHYLERINDFCIRDNICDKLAKQLIDNQLYTNTLLNITKNQQSKSINYFTDEEAVNVLSACRIINEILPEDIVLIRRKLVSLNGGKLYKKYKDLYEGEYSLISIEELNEIDDFIEAMSVIDASKFTDENYKDYVDFINEREHRGRECYIIFDYLFNPEYEGLVCKNQNICASIVETLDYDKILFGTMTDEEIKSVVKLLGKFMNLLNDLALQKKFMKLVKCLLPEFEIKIVQKAGIESYVAYINECDLVSDYTLEAITQYPAKYGLPNHVTDELIKKGYIEYYIVGKTLHDGFLTYPMEGVQDEELIKLFNEKSVIWEYIKENTVFLECIMRKRLYRSIQETVTYNTLEPLMHIKQKSDFLKFVLAVLDEDKIRRYLMNLYEIETEEDSIEISKILTEEKNLKFLIDNETFANIEFRLWDNVKTRTGYKSSFTRKRNAYISKIKS